MRGPRDTTELASAAHPLHTVAVLCAIAAPLILAGVLEQGGGGEARASLPLRTAVLAPATARGAAAIDPAPQVVPPPTGRAGVDLAARSHEDALRLRDERGFTLQFAVMCRDENVRQILVELEADPRLYVLPATIDGRACHRVCYGAYESEVAARAASPPEALRALPDEPRAVSVARVAP